MYKRQVKTKVTITFKGSDYGDSFTGRVKAKAKGTPSVKRKLKRKCVKRRKVVVFRKLTTGKQRIGKTRSNRRGRWVRSINGLADPGRYFAKVKRKKIRYKGKRYVCKKGRSKRILVS